MALTPEDDKLLDLILPQKEGQDNTTISSLNNTNTNLLVKAVSDSGVSLSAESEAILRNFMEQSQFGHQAGMIMKCKALKCPYLQACPLYQASLPLPQGKKCPVEIALMQQWVDRTITALGIDREDAEYAVDIDMIYEIAGMELVRNRAAYELSENARLIEDKIVGYSQQGKPIFEEKPRAALFIIEKNSKVINRIREQLLATRKAQASVGKITNESSARAAKLREKAREITMKRREKAPINDVEYTVIEEELPSNE